MTTTSKGPAGKSVLNFQGLPFANPNNRGSTGLAFGNVFPYPRSMVIDYLSHVDYGKPQGEGWDCEDMSYYGLARARCKFPGEPCAIALGTAKEGAGIVGTKHAVIMLWYEFQEEGKKVWNNIFFDATLGTVVNDFGIDIIIPFPIAGIGGSQSIKPFDKLPHLDKAAFALDQGYDFGLYDDLKNDLESQNFSECEIPQDINELITWTKFYSYEDRVFNWFTQARKKHKGSAIGYAFGSLKVENKPPQDFACLALWKAKNTDPEYWVIQKGPIVQFKKSKFEPRIMIA